MKFKDAIREYKQYLIVEKGSSSNTVTAYCADLELFFKYLCNEYNKSLVLSEITQDHIDRYQTYLSLKNSTATSKRKIVSLRNFYIFLIKEKHTDHNLNFTIPKQQAYLPVVLSQDEVIMILNSIETNSDVGYRNKVMVELLYATGIRVSELIYLKIEHVNTQLSFIRVIGKGDVERIVPIHQLISDMISTYILEIRDKFLIKDSAYLFLNNRGNPLDRHSFYIILKKIIQKSGVNKYCTPHTFRHTCATHLLENNADLRSIQEILGHKDINTTTIYTHVSNQKLYAEYNNFHPRSKKEKT